VKTHYCLHTDIGPHDSRCGRRWQTIAIRTDDWAEVTCRLCLRLRLGDLERNRETWLTYAENGLPPIYLNRPQRWIDRGWPTTPAGCMARATRMLPEIVALRRRAHGGDS